MRDLYTITIGRINFEGALTHGAGLVKNRHHAVDSIRSASAAVTVGSTTAPRRDGNENDPYYRGEFFSMNSKGMPNPGVEAIPEELEAIVGRSHAIDKPVIHSGATDGGPEQYAEVAEASVRCGVDVYEVNAGCPNIWGSKQHRILSFNSEELAKVLDMVNQAIDGKIDIWVKLSPISDPVQRQEIAQICVEKGATALVLCNTFPNGFAYDEDGNQAIRFKAGLAGVSGRAMFPIALGHIRELRPIIPKHVHLIGAGGVTFGQDVQEYLNAGASLVEATTVVFNEGWGAFSRINEEWFNETPRPKVQYVYA